MKIFVADGRTDGKTDNQTELVFKDPPVEWAGPKHLARPSSCPTATLNLPRHIFDCKL